MDLPSRACCTLAVGLAVVALVVGGATATAASPAVQSGDDRGTVTATASVDGVTASGVAVEDPDAAEEAIASALDPLPASNVRAREDGTVAVLTERSPAAVAAAMNRSGYVVDPGAVESGVDGATARSVAADVERRLRSVGSDAAVTADGTMLTVTVANASLEAVTRRLRAEPYALYAYLPGESGQTRIRLLDGAGDLAAVGEVRTGGGVSVPVTLTESAAADVAATLVESGFAEDGVDRCRSATSFGNYCLVTVVGERVTVEAALAPDLAESIRSGEFESERQFEVLVANETRAERLRDAASTPAPPAPLTVHSAAVGEPGGQGDGASPDGASSATDGTATEADGTEATGVSGFGGTAALLAVVAAIVVGGLGVLAIRRRPL